MNRIAGHDPEHKICRLLDFSEHPRDIADPWYTGDFETTYSDIVEGCRAFLETFAASEKNLIRLQQQKAISQKTAKKV